MEEQKQDLASSILPNETLYIKNLNEKIKPKGIHFVKDLLLETKTSLY